MKVIIAFVALFLIAVSSTNTCEYTASNGIEYYLETLAYESNYYLNATDAKGNLWYFVVCDDTDEGDSVSNYVTSPCPAGSSVCVSINGAPTIDRGSNTPVISDSPYGEGIEMVYGSDAFCEDKTSAIKTSIEFVCNPQLLDPVVTVQIIDVCFAQITVNSSHACGYYEEDDMDGEYYEGYDHEYAFVSLSFTSLMFCGIVLTCLSCCCCCMVRRRRCAQKKALAMKQFSNVAFQPIPSNTVKVQNPVQQPQSTLPAYNPYIMQPQFVYYYPNQAQVQLDTQDDEKLAIELQAKFDRESQV